METLPCPTTFESQRISMSWKPSIEHQKDVEKDKALNEGPEILI